MADYDDRKDLYRYDSEPSTPRSEGFDYPAGVRRGLSVSVSDSGTENESVGENSGSPERTIDQAHKEVEGSRESLTDRFKRYMRRILPVGRRSSSSRNSSARPARRELRVPLERYGRARSGSRSSSSDNYEYDEQYDSDHVAPGHRHRHVRANFHYNNRPASAGRDKREDELASDEGGVQEYEEDYDEDEVYDPSPESAGSSLHSGHVHHRYIRSGVARVDNGPAEAVGEASGGEEDENGAVEELSEDGELELEDGNRDGVSDRESYLTDGPVSPRSRSSSSAVSSASRSRGSSSSRSPARSRSSSGSSRGTRARGRASSRSRSSSGSRSRRFRRSRTRSSSRGSRSTSASGSRSRASGRRSRN